MDWSHLPREVVDNVCMDGSAVNGFRRNPDTEYWEHAKCGKPTILAAVAECDICEKVFIPEKYVPLKIRDLGVICSGCI